jgi:hypothetical protein
MVRAVGIADHNKQETTMQLSDLERQALKAAFDSARGNGHDFGFIEDVVRSLQPISTKTANAVVGALIKKRLIEVHAPVVTNDGGRANTLTQFTWTVDVAEVERLIVAHINAPAEPDYDVRYNSRGSVVVTVEGAQCEMSLAQAAQFMAKLAGVVAAVANRGE